MRPHLLSLTVTLKVYHNYTDENPIIYSQIDYFTFQVSAMIFAAVSDGKVDSLALVREVLCRKNHYQSNELANFASFYRISDLWMLFITYRSNF